MENSHDCCVVLTTCGSREDAEKLAGKIVMEKLAACVQMDQVKSCYVWEGELNMETEVRLMIKTVSARYERLEAFITANHSYEVPEIIMLPVEKGSLAYLAWVGDSLK